MAMFMINHPVDTELRATLCQNNRALLSFGRHQIMDRKHHVMPGLETTVRRKPTSTVQRRRTTTDLQPTVHPPLPTNIQAIYQGEGSWYLSCWLSKNCKEGRGLL